MCTVLAGVLADVGERLLDDPVDGELEPGAVRPGRPSTSRLDVEAGRCERPRPARGIWARSGSGPIPCRSRRCAAHRASAASRPAPPVRGARRPAAPRAARPVRAPGCGGRARLDAHDADRVRDHVVELAGDAGALGHERGVHLERWLRAAGRRARPARGTLPLAVHLLADEPRCRRGTASARPRRQRLVPEGERLEGWSRRPRPPAPTRARRGVAWAASE
jgi:hypothetical protein